MRGLKYPESEKFENYFTMVQATMYKNNCVFFLDAGDGNEFETEALEGENLVGWAISELYADEFEAKWLAGEDLSAYDDHYYLVEWGGNPKHLKIHCLKCDRY